MDEIKRTKLTNGTRVILVPRRESGVVTVQVLVGIGSRDESPELNGAAHFIEHTMFKGTKRRPNTMAISRELDAVGADYNAFTDREYTGYYVKLQAAKVALAVDVVADMLLNSQFRTEDLDSERKVIIEEVRRYLDDPSGLAFDKLYDVMFPGIALGRPIVGTVETVTGLDREALVGFRDRYYVPANTVVTVAGRFDETYTMGLLEHGFGVQGAAFVRSGRGDRYCAPPAKVVMHKKADAEQANVAMGFMAYGHDDPRLPTLKVLSNVLGGTMSSRLFENVREKHGLAYAIGSSASTHHGVGTLEIGAGLAKDRLEPAIDLIVQELAKLQTGGITEEELHRAQENIRGGAALQHESASAIASFYGYRETLRLPAKSIERTLDEIAAVTTENVRAVIDDVVDKNRLALVIVSPFDDPAPYEKIVARL